VDAANLLVLQQTIVTVPERPHPAPKLRPARVFIHLSTKKVTKNKFGSSATSRNQGRGTNHASGSSDNEVPPTANMAVDMESVNPSLPSLSLNHSETESIEPVVNPCAEAWTNTFCYRATLEGADSDEESDEEEDRTLSSESEDGRDGLLSDSDSIYDELRIEDTINDEF
jgi:hypothetical protein